MTTEIGRISRRDKEGLKGRSKIIWAACPSCGIERWVMLNLYRRQEGLVRCSSCIGKEAIARGINNAPHKADCTCHRCRTTRGELTREKNPAWNGGTCMRGGYRAVLLGKDDPLRSMADIHGYALEHRVVVARALGRTLASYEHVHHINGDKTDNRIENLELWMRQHPSGVRFRDYHCPGCRCFEQQEVHHGE